MSVDNDTTDSCLEEEEFDDTSSPCFSEPAGARALGRDASHVWRLLEGIKLEARKAAADLAAESAARTALRVQYAAAAKETSGKLGRVQSVQQQATRAVMTSQRSLKEMSSAIAALQDSSLKQRMAATHSLLQEACDMRARRLEQLDWTAAAPTAERARPGAVIP